MAILADLAASMRADLAEVVDLTTTVVGIGVETVGTDAGLAASFDDQPFPATGSSMAPANTARPSGTWRSFHRKMPC